MPSLVDTGAYLDQLYQEKFGRAADAAGKEYWKKEIDSGRMDASSVANAFQHHQRVNKLKQLKKKRPQIFSTIHIKRN